MDIQYFPNYYFESPYRPTYGLAAYKNKGLRIVVKKPSWNASLFYEGNLLSLTDDSITIGAYNSRKGGMTKVTILETDIYYIEYLAKRTKLNIKELSSKHGESISFTCRDKSLNKICSGNKDLNGNCLYGGILKSSNNTSITIDAYDGNGSFITLSVAIPDIVDCYWYKWAFLNYK